MKSHNEVSQPMNLPMQQNHSHQVSGRSATVTLPSLRARSPLPTSATFIPLSPLLPPLSQSSQHAHHPQPASRTALDTQTLRER